MNDRANEYRQQVQRSICFIGQGVDYFTEVKVQILLRLAKTHLGETNQLTALDVGCGVGLTDKLLVGSLAELHGVDISRTDVESASKENPTAKYQWYDGSTLPFTDPVFDLVFAVNVLHHVPMANRDALVEEMARVVKPGGCVALFEHNPLNLLTRLAVKRCEFDAGVELVWPGKAAGMLTKSGLSVADRSYIVFFPFKSRLLSRVESGLGWLPLGAQHYVLGKKTAK